MGKTPDFSAGLFILEHVFFFFVLSSFGEMLEAMCAGWPSGATAQQLCCECMGRGPPQASMPTRNICQKVLFS